MSYSIFGKIFNNGQQVAEGVFDRLKNLCEMNYSADMEDVKNIDAPADSEHVGEYYYNSFAGYMKTSELDKLTRIDDPENPCDFVIDENQESLLTKDLENEDGYTSIYVRNKREHNGSWYNADSFLNACEIYKEQKEQKEVSLRKLNDILSSKDYYLLDSDGKSDLTEDISNLKDDIDDIEYKIAACDEMFYILDFYSNSFWDGKKYPNKEAEVFIYAE